MASFFENIGNNAAVDESALASKTAAEAAKVAAETAQTEAESSAAAALSSASTVTTSITASAASAAAALVSENNATTKASEAAVSAATSTTRASESAASAATSTAQASTATTQASTSTSQAAISTTKATEAAASAATATTQANTSTSQSTISTNKAAIATAQASTATTQASTATTKASEAAASATTATTKASESAASQVISTAQAVIATTKASESAASQVVSTTKATEAAASAATATTQATTATTKATESAASQATSTAQATISTTKATEAAASAATATTKASEAAASASSTNALIDPTVLKVDATNNRIGINDTTPSVSIDAASNTDAIAVPVGTTAQRPADGAGRFRYNSTTQAFEGYTTEWGSIAGGGGTNTFTTDSFTANGSTTAYALSQVTSSEDSLLVFIDGVFQTQDAYTIATASGATTLTFSAAPANARKIVIYSVAAAVSGSNLNIDSMTGDGTDVTLTLSIAPVNVNNTIVTIDGVYQAKANYSISGTTLTFSTAPPAGSAVEVMTFTQTEINVPVDNTITSAKLSGALTTPSTLVATGKITADAGIDIDNINIDGTTIALSSGDLTLDAAGSIILESNDGVVKVKDGSSAYGAQIDLSDDNNVTISALIANRDIIFKGVDHDGFNGTPVTALSLDMSASGRATFNNNVVVTDNNSLIAGSGDDLQIYYDGTNGEIDVSSGNLTLDVAGETTVDSGLSGILNLKHSGTLYGTVYQDSNNLHIKSQISDGDLKLQGVDGGSLVTALTLDMSAGGAATFTTHIGVNTPPNANWNAAWGAAQISPKGALYGQPNDSVGLIENGYFSDNWRAITTGTGTIYQQASGEHNFYTMASVSAGAVATPTNHLKLTTTGQLGVFQSGATSVRSDIAMTVGTGISTKRWGLGGHTGNSSVFYVINEGNVGVYLNHGSQAWIAHSDERIKENITDVGTVLPSLMNMRCVKYNLISKPDDTKIGFIAQDWESSFPEIVDENEHLVLEDDGTIGTDDDSDSTTPVKAMAYTETIPLLLKAIQELKEELNTATARITELENN